MSDITQQEKTQQNEEIVESLINDLNITKNDINKENTESLKSGDDNPNIIPDDFEKDDDTPKDPFIIDEVDEEELKLQQESLTEDQKESLHKEALEFKQIGNEEFKTEKYLESINNYTKALNICPLAYSNDRAIFYCNRAASKMKLQRDDLAIEDCTKAITLNGNYLKAYVRRAKLYEGKDKLDESLEDYKKILELDPGNGEARAACVRLPPMIHERNEKLKTEMLGKLKDFGNLLLKPFGLSTANFQLQQDPNSGGYSVNFQQNKPS
ncbi:tetratricopeptide repeat protein 1-like [Onthophagus taurus]|uniref:tetratricopeptide repeat protein 1-like n=1 Tax=Onthophagus taurus TaxID=166361 RepID=UPI000C20CB40|nr:tetratricopeptide repeat protein 1-like [Onthophagus taurus]